MNFFSCRKPAAVLDTTPHKDKGRVPVAKSKCNGRNVAKLGLKVLGGAALAGLIAFGILGLLQTSGVHNMPGFLGKGIEAISHEAAFGAMIGAGGIGGVVALVAIKRTYSQRFKA